MFNRMKSITVDYQNEILLIDGKKVTNPIKIIIKEPDGWDESKLFNNDSAKQGLIYPELVIDAREFFADLQRQELKEIVRAVIKETFPAEQADNAGNDC